MKIEDLACLMGKSVEEVKEILQEQDCVCVDLKERKTRCNKEKELEIVVV